MPGFPKNERMLRVNYPKSIRLFRFNDFLSHFDIGDEDECWEWQGSIDHRGGYGRFIWKEKCITKAHQAAYEFFRGDRRGLQVCHNCPDGDNPACVNPRHLWLGTQEENINDMDSKGRRRFQYGPNPLKGHKGEDNSQAKLTWEIVDKIRRKYKTGKYTKKDLGVRYGISVYTVVDVLRNKSWKE
jgi:hypothetical protein